MGADIYAKTVDVMDTVALIGAALAGLGADPSTASKIFFSNIADLIAKKGWSFADEIGR